MIVRATFKRSNGLYKSCLIRLNGWKEVTNAYGCPKPIFRFSFSRHSLRFTLFVYCIMIWLVGRQMLVDYNPLFIFCFSEVTVSSDSNYNNVDNIGIIINSNNNE